MILINAHKRNFYTIFLSFMSKISWVVGDNFNKTVELLSTAMQVNSWQIKFQTYP